MLRAKGMPDIFRDEIHQVLRDFFPIAREAIRLLKKEISESFPREEAKIIEFTLRKSRLPYFCTLATQYSYRRAKLDILPEEKKELIRATECFMALGVGGEIKDDLIDSPQFQKRMEGKGLEEIESILEDDESFKDVCEDFAAQRCQAYLKIFDFGLRNLGSDTSIEKVLKWKKVSEKCVAQEVFLAGKLRNEGSRALMGLSLEELLEPQGKLGAIAAGVIDASNETFNCDRLSHQVSQLFYHFASQLNLIGDDFKEYKEDFKKRDHSIADPSNFLALAMASMGFEPNYSFLKQFVKTNEDFLERGINYFMPKIEESVVQIAEQGDWIDRKLTRKAIGFPFAWVIGRHLRKFDKEFHTNFYERLKAKYEKLMEKLKE